MKSMQGCPHFPTPQRNIFSQIVEVPFVRTRDIKSEEVSVTLQHFEAREIEQPLSEAW